LLDRLEGAAGEHQGEDGREGSGVHAGAPSQAPIQAFFLRIARLVA
jgi:hypothetical protein